MSFTTFIQNPESQKVTLFEIDLSETIPFWICEEAGIWKYKLTNFIANSSLSFENGSFCYGNFKGGGTENTGTNSLIKSVGSLTVDAVAYIAVTSMADLRSTNNSFYYDGSTVIHVHFNGNATPYKFSSITAGIISRFSDYDFYYNNEYVSGKIQSIPQISISQDKINYGLQTYDGGAVTLLNTDGGFDSFVTQSLFGQVARIKLGGTTLSSSEFKTLYTGFVQDVDSNEDETTIQLADNRQKLSRKLPVRFFNDTTFPNISDDNNGKPIPLHWGAVTKAEAFCINDDEGGAANYKFVIADITKHSIKAVTAVYVNDTVLGALPALVNDTTDNVAYFLIPTASYDPGQDVTWTGSGFDNSLTRNGSGTVISNNMDIVKDILADYADTPYNATNYDTTAWSAITGVTCSQVSIFDLTPINEILEKLARSSLVTIIQSGDGKWTGKKQDQTAAFVLRLRQDEVFNPVQVSYKGEELLASATIKYDKEKEYTDTSQETAIYNEYLTRPNGAIETFIATYADAKATAEELVEMFKTIRPEFTIETSIAAAEVELFDVIVAEINRQQKTWFGNVKLEIWGISYNLNDYKITLRARYIENYDEIDVTTGAVWEDDTIVFPDYLGGGDASVWDKDWTLEQKIYAKSNFGYWTDENGYIDSLDPDSYMGSQWRS